MAYNKFYQQFLIENPYPRTLKSLEPIQGSSYFMRHGKKLINFSSSDYLGLSQHPLLLERSQEYIRRFGIGTGASRLVTGNLTLFDELEQQLAKVLQKPAALILGTGYQTNISVIEALIDKKIFGQEPLVFCDRLCHVSMITNTRHLVRLHRFQHNNLQHLRRLLEKFSHSTQPKFILVESVYSMDGDQADLAQLIQLADEFNAFLYVDDAHAVSVFGISGWGRAPQYAEHIPLIMGTFSKGLGSYGGYIGCSEIVREFLINQCKGFIYSTAPSPAILGAISAVIDILPTLNDRRERVLQYATRLRAFFQKIGLNYGQSNTHIVPWIIGNAEKTRMVSEWLDDRGILGTAIQPPSVPAGMSRIRFNMTAAHSEEDLHYLMEIIQEVAGKL